MQRPKIIIASVAVAAIAAVGGTTAALASGSSSSSAAPTSSPSSAPASRRRRQLGRVRTAQATVNGKTETILVDAQGLPLYYYQPDTATQSPVTGQLAVRGRR